MLTAGADDAFIECVDELQSNCVTLENWQSIYSCIGLSKRQFRETVLTLLSAPDEHTK